MKVFRLSFASVAANFDERTRLHCETDTVQHEPSSFLGYAEGAGKLTGTYAILAVDDDPHGRQPVLNPESGILKEGCSPSR